MFVREEPLALNSFYLQNHLASLSFYVQWKNGINIEGNFESHSKSLKNLSKRVMLDRFMCWITELKN